MEDIPYSGVNPNQGVIPNEKIFVLERLQFLFWSEFYHLKSILTKVTSNIFRIIDVLSSVPDPEPDLDPPGSGIIWPQGSRSEINNFGSGSSPFSHHA